MLALKPYWGADHSPGGGAAASARGAGHGCGAPPARVAAFPRRVDAQACLSSSLRKAVVGAAEWARQRRTKAHKSVLDRASHALVDCRGWHQRYEAIMVLGRHCLESATSHWAQQTSSCKRQSGPMSCFGVTVRGTFISSVAMVTVLDPARHYFRASLQGL
jgi:hypothetical protein